MSWQQTIEETKGSIVAIMVDQVRAFEDDWQHSGQASGFVVDAERGIVLTNRHVVTTGPIVARGIFADLREVVLWPLYRDPIHDFGFLQYDPSELRGAVPRSLPLYPEGAREGVDIRVIGNDAGEGYSILSGTLSRLDRDAPDYGEGNYSDWNTFYMQAASMTSGGSSGSPVIDEVGRVVGLNAGGHREAAAAYFLPLRTVVRALSALQRGEKVSRGTIHLRASHISYDELLRQGVPRDILAESIKALPRSTGLLVVDRLLPMTEAARVLHVGDVIVRVNGDLIDSFDPFEEALDRSVGGCVSGGSVSGASVSLTVVRAGSQLVVTLPIDDLDTLVPKEFIEVGEAIFHPISAVHTWHLNTAPRGVVLADPGYMFVDEGFKKGALVETVAGVAIDCLDSLAAVFERLRQGETFSIRYRHYKQPSTPRHATFVFSTKWFPCRHWKRQEGKERWRSELLAASGELLPEVANLVQRGGALKSAWHKVQSALVHIQFRAPYVIAGWHRYDTPRGTGVIIDKGAGLVATDRSTVWHALGDVTITIAGNVEVPGRVVFVHPLHNLVLIQYDPLLLGEIVVGEASLAAEMPSVGSDVHLIGVNEYGSIQVKKAAITSIRSSSTRPLAGSFFQETNSDLIQLNARHADFNGVIVGDEGCVIGFWGIFASKEDQDFEFTHIGLPAFFLDDLRALGRGERCFRWIEAEVAPIRLPEVRRLRVTTEWMKRIGDAIGDGRRHILRVVRTSAGGPSDGRLEPGDVILAVNGVVPTDHRTLEELVQAESVTVTVWREGAEHSVVVEPIKLSGEGVNHILHWAGAVLHAPHPEVSRILGEMPVGVHVASGNYGSPSFRFGVEVGSQIISLNNRPTPDLASFIAEARALEGAGPVVVRFIESGSIERLVTLLPEPDLWPTYELERNPDGGWERRDWGI
jgi:S1-C subfamily serine protease